MGLGSGWGANIFAFGGLKKGGRTPQNNYDTHYSQPASDGPRRYRAVGQSRGGERGFQIILSRIFVGEAFPFISVLEVAFLFRCSAVCFISNSEGPFLLFLFAPHPGPSVLGVRP